VAEPAVRWPGARWLVLGAAAIVLVVHSLAYNFVTDDAFISFVFSRNLAEHGELSFNLGQPVEGYTSFLWTVVLGVGMRAGIAPEWSSRVLGTGCALATLYLVFRLAERALGRRTPWAAMPALLLACSSGFACWTSGGLETQLYTLLVTAALDALVAGVTEPRALRRIGAILALASMTRPEGPMVAAVLGAVWIGRRVALRFSAAGGAGVARGVRDEVIAVVWFVALWAPWFLWRWWYYGWPFPNTYYVKATGPWAGADLPGQMLHNGLYYVWVWLRQSHVLHALPLVVVGAATAPPRTPRFVLAVTCVAFSAVYLAYTVSVGGDFMGLHRFILPVFVAAALLVTLGAEWLVGAVGVDRWAGALGALAERALMRSRIRSTLGRWLRAAVSVGVEALPAAALVAGFAVTQWQLTRASLRWGNFDSDRGIDTPIYLATYTADRAAIGRAMAGCFAPDDFSIVGGAGAQPYFARMRGVDVFGLVSETIAHDLPRVRARAGHTKFGTDRVLAGYDPTFVFSCYQIHPGPAQPQLPCAGFWLASGFEPVTMHIPGMRLQGEYYTFLARKARNFQCPGRVH
jgi:hypothetical protein